MCAALIVVGVLISEEVKRNWTLYEYPGPTVWTG
jgi:hypothetical protein